MELIKDKEFFFKHRQTGVDNIKTEIELNKTIHVDVYSKLVNSKDTKEISNELKNYNRLQQVVKNLDNKKNKVASYATARTKDKDALDKELEEDEGMTQQEAKTKMNKLQTTTNFENK